MLQRRPLTRRGRRRGSVAGSLLVVAATAGALMYVAGRGRAADADLPTACTSWAAARMIAQAETPAADPGPLVQALVDGRALSPDEVTDLKSRVGRLRDMYATLNGSLADVAEAARTAPQARRTVDTEAGAFLDELERADRAHRDAVARVQAAASTEALIDALVAFTVPPGPALATRNALYAVVASEPACRPLLDAAVAAP